MTIRDRLQYLTEMDPMFEPLDHRPNGPLPKLHRYPPGIWVTFDGRAIDITRMADGHLQNSVNMVLRQLWREMAGPKVRVPPDIERDPRFMRWANLRCPKLSELLVEFKQRQMLWMAVYGTMEGGVNMAGPRFWPGDQT